jgi:hypothetical protein
MRTFVFSGIGGGCILDLGVRDCWEDSSQFVTFPLLLS